MAGTHTRATTPILELEDAGTHRREDIPIATGTRRPLRDPFASVIGLYA